MIWCLAHFKRGWIKCGLIYSLSRTDKKKLVVVVSKNFNIISIKVQRMFKREKKQQKYGKVQKTFVLILWWELKIKKSV